MDAGCDVRGGAVVQSLAGWNVASATAAVVGVAGRLFDIRFSFSNGTDSAGQLHPPADAARQIMGSAGVVDGARLRGSSGPGGNAARAPRTSLTGRQRGFVFSGGTGLRRPAP